MNQREIKFRLRIRGEKGFQYVSLDDFLQDYGLSENLSLVKVLSKDQFTGLKDKNGKEIYEGDIVEIGLRVRGKNSKYEIRWSNLRAGWICWKGGGEIKEINILPTEVIGSIYENNNLLK